MMTPGEKSHSLPDYQHVTVIDDVAIACAAVASFGYGDLRDRSVGFLWRSRVGQRQWVDAVPNTFIEFVAGGATLALQKFIGTKITDKNLAALTGIMGRAMQEALAESPEWLLKIKAEYMRCNP